VFHTNKAWWTLRGFPERSDADSQNKILEEILAMQISPVSTQHTQLITTILSCIPQVCRGIPTRAHWIYPSPATGETVLVYLKMIPIANEAMEAFQFLLICYEIKLPPHLSIDPLRIISEPTVQPKITAVTQQQPQQQPPSDPEPVSPMDFQKYRAANEWEMGFEINSVTSSLIDHQSAKSHAKDLVDRRARDGLFLPLYEDPQDFPPCPPRHGLALRSMNRR
jgi:hypothetical protein